jgi:hypothetical protein
MSDTDRKTDNRISDLHNVIIFLSPSLGLPRRLYCAIDFGVVGVGALEHFDDFATLHRQLVFELVLVLEHRREIVAVGDERVLLVLQRNALHFQVANLRTKKFMKPPNERNNKKRCSNWVPCSPSDASPQAFACS